MQHVARLSASVLKQKRQARQSRTRAANLYTYSLKVPSSCRYSYKAEVLDRCLIEALIRNTNLSYTTERTILVQDAHCSGGMRKDLRPCDFAK